MKPRRLSTILLLLLLPAVAPAEDVIVGATLSAEPWGGFAAHPWLDAGARVELSAPATVTVDFRIERRWLHGDRASDWPEGAQRTITREMPAGIHEIRLSDDGQYLWRMNTELGNAAHRLHGTVTVGADKLVMEPVELHRPKVRGGQSVTRESFASVPREGLHRLRIAPRRDEVDTSGTLQLMQPGFADNGTRTLLALRPEFWSGGVGPRAADFYTEDVLQEPDWEASDATLSTGRSEDLVWLKTLEWRFNSSPYSSGWDAIPGPSVVPYYATDSTRKLADEVDIFERSPRIPRRVHRLAIETRGTGEAVGGWKIINLFRNPRTDHDRTRPGREHPELAYDFTNRLLRFDVILSADSDGDQIPPIRFSVEGDAFVYTHEIEKLLGESGEPVAAGTFVSRSFYLHPPHYLKDVSKRLDFSFEVTGAADATVYLENLQVWETPIADLPPPPLDPNMPMGLNQPAPEPLWPAVSMLREVPGGETPVIKPMVPQCDAPESDGGRHYFADHAMFLDGENRWHLYGIYNTRLPFAPLDDAGEPLANGPFNTGLIHAQACDAGAPIDAMQDNRAAWRGPQFDGPDRRTRGVFVDPDLPSFFFGPWAPKVVRKGDEYIMFYTEHDLHSPHRFRGFRYSTTRTPEDAMSWRAWEPEPGQRLVYTLPQHNTARDIDIVSRREGDGERYFAIWTGYREDIGGDGGSGKVLAKSVLGDPRLLHTVPAEEEYTIYDLHQSDSGRIDSECESPALIHDPATDLFYLKVTKNGTWYPGHAFDNDVLALDRTNKRLVLGERTMGDRSVHLGDAAFIDPIAMQPMESFPRWITVDHGHGVVEFRYRAAVLDAGDEKTPPALLRVDCVDGGSEFFGVENRADFPFRNPTSLERVPFIERDGQPYSGYLISDAAEKPREGRVFLAEEDSTTFTLSPPREIVTGLYRPRALHLVTEGDTPASVTVNGPAGTPLFTLSAARPGIRPTEFNGRLYVGIQVPEKPNTPLSITPFYGSFYPNLHMSILLRTNEQGEPVTTLAELAEAMETTVEAQEHLRLSHTPLFDVVPVPPGAYELGGGTDTRTLYYVDESDTPGRPFVFTVDLSDIDAPGRPTIAVSSYIDWEPVSLQRRDNWLFVLDAKRNAIFRLDMNDGLPEVRDESAILMRGMPTATALHQYRDALGDDLLVTGEGFVGRLDPETGALDLWLSSNRGHGAELGNIVDAVPVYWNTEGIDAGAKIYWSRLDSETGRLEPFTADRYIGYLPYYASELHRDPNQPGAPWYTSFNETNREGGYGLRRIEWLPELGAEK